MRKWKFASMILSVCVASSAFAQVDYRAQQSPVKNQGGRGTCAAFAIIAAMETFPGVPTDLSEQMLYATIKLHQNNMDLWRQAYGFKLEMGIGDNFQSYATLAGSLGTCPEWFFPYNPNPIRVPEGVPAEVRRFVELAQVTQEDLQRLREAVGVYRMIPAADGLLGEVTTRDVERIKRELDRGRLAIPVGYRVHEPSWSDIGNIANFDRAGVRDIIHPGMMDRFAPAGGDWMTYNQAKARCMQDGIDLVDAIRRGQWVRERSFPSGYGGHGVTIVGYDDHGFIIKNSWGEDWASSGYARVNYDYHRLYATEALLIDRVNIEDWPSSSLRRTPGIRDGRWRLKVQPVRTEAGESWELSSWALEPLQPQAQIVEYTVQAYRAGAGWERVAWWSVLKTTTESRNGFPLRLRPEEYRSIVASEWVSITVRYGYFSLDDPSRMDEAVFVGQREYGPFQPGLPGAVDLTPRSGR